MVLYYFCNMKKYIFLALLVLPFFATAQSNTWEKYVSRTPKGAEIVHIKVDENGLPAKVQYQALNSPTKVTLAFVSKSGDGGQTENDKVKFKNPATGKIFELNSFAMGGLVTFSDGRQAEFYPEITYVYKTEKIYTTSPPIIAYAYYANNGMPIAQPITKDVCEQEGGGAWICTGTIPVTNGACTLKIEVAKKTATLTTPKGTKIFTEVKE